MHRGVLHRPLLYLSVYLRRHRAEYYDRLTAIRESGDWEGWLRFFLKGVAQTADEASATARAILQLRESSRVHTQELGLGVHGVRLIDLLFTRPVVNVNFVKEALGVSYMTANKLIERLAEEGALEEITGRRRDRVFSFTPYLQFFTKEHAPAELVASQTTEA
jgi:Fic family protein